MIIPVRYTIAAWLLAAGIIVSCATKFAYYNNLKGLTAQGRYLDGAVLVEQSKESAYGEKNALLFYLDKGMLLHLGGNYAESNDCFEQAKKLSENYFTKSVTTEASTLLVSDTMRPYYGEDFERALINIFCALNYLMLNSPVEALVEARQVDHFLATLQINYGYKNKYKEDAFARYLMGMIYENQNQINDAFISYRKALDAYQDGLKAYGVAVPRALISDALRTAQQLGFSDEIKDIARIWGMSPAAPPPPSDGELIVLAYNGFAPEKVETIFEIAFGKAWAYVGGVTVKGNDEAQVDQAAGIARAILFDEQVRMAFPKYERVPSRITRFRAITPDIEAPSEIVDDISALAEQSLNDRITRIRVRAIARAAIKFALARKISQQVQEQSGNDALGWLTKKALAVASATTEHADTRSWRSLPDKILISRLPLYAGTHTVTLKFFSDGGAEIQSETLKDVVIKPGKKTFVIVRSAQ